MLQKYTNYIKQVNFFKDDNVNRTVTIRNKNMSYNENKLNQIKNIKETLKLTMSEPNAENLQRTIKMLKTSNLNVGEINDVIRKILTAPIVY